MRLKAHLREDHPDTDEGASLIHSINQSFCLLEPGSDIQQEALGDLEMPSQENVSAPAPGLHSQADIPGSISHCCQGLKSQNVPLLSESEQANTEITNCTAAKLADSSGVASEASAEDLLHRLMERENNHLYANLTVDNVSASVNHASAKSSDLQDGEADGLAQKVSFDQSDIKDHADNDPRPLLSSPSHLPANMGNGGAFMAILNGLQKRQLNMELLQKIRKVYGELECEYCGK